MLMRATSSDQHFLARQILRQPRPGVHRIG